MGLDLDLMPFDGEYFSHTILPCNRRSELFEQLMIAEKAGRDVPENFQSFRSRDDKYEESHYGLTVETPYGEPLKYLKAGVLKGFASHPEVKGDYRNRAVWAFIAELPDNKNVALFWH